VKLTRLWNGSRDRQLAASAIVMPTPSADNQPTTEASQTTSRASSRTDFHMGAIPPRTKQRAGTFGSAPRHNLLSSCRVKGTLSASPLDFPLPDPKVPHCPVVATPATLFLSIRSVQSSTKFTAACKDLQGYPLSSAYHCNLATNSLSHQLFRHIALGLMPAVP